MLLFLVVKALVDLTEGSLPKTLDDFVPIPDVISNVAYVLGALRAVDVLYGKGFSAICEDADDLAPDSAEAVDPDVHR